jgi:hypothetical protein
MKTIASWIFAFAYGSLIGHFRNNEWAVLIGFVGGILFAYIQIAFHFGKTIMEVWKSRL